MIDVTMFVPRPCIGYLRAECQVGPTVGTGACWTPSVVSTTAMNFLDTYDIPTSITPTPESQQQEQSLNDEVTQVVGQLTRFWGGFRKQAGFLRRIVSTKS